MIEFRICTAESSQAKIVQPLDSMSNNMLSNSVEKMRKEYRSTIQLGY
jgi:predicted DNA-binding protein (UPF0278 family)